MKWLLLLIFCAGCAKPEVTTFSGLALTIPYRIHILGCVDESAVESIIAKTFFEIDSTFNIWNPNSELSRLNAQKLGVATSLSSSLRALLQTARALSDERFDPTLGASIAAWKKSMPYGNACIETYPSGWHHIDIETGIKTAPVAIDLDGLLKGYGVDLLVERLIEAGYTALCVDWGGDIAAIGHPWKIAVGNEIISVENRAIATSGNGVQRFHVGDSVYTHLFNANGTPTCANTLASVTIMAPTCLLADALATTCMLFPSQEEALKWLNANYPNITVKFN